MTAAVEVETIRETIRRHVDLQVQATGETDAFEITRSILHEVGADVYRLAWICQQLLPTVVSEVVRGGRQRHDDRESPEPPVVPDTPEELDLFENVVEHEDDLGEGDLGEDDFTEPEPPIAPPIPLRPRNPSARGLSVSSKYGSTWYHNLMEQQFSKPGGKRQTMALGDMRKFELEHNVDERRRVAQGALAWSSQLEGMIAALEQYGKTRVRDLPQAVVANIMQRAS
jgi:hypothetical protein